MSEYTRDQKKEIAKEAKEKGIKLVAQEKGIHWLTVRAWVGAYCRKKKSQPIALDTSPHDCECNTVPIEVIEDMLTYADTDIISAYWKGYKAGRGI